MIESTAKLRQEILAISGVDIMLDNTTFKSTYQILDELAKKWEDLTDIQQATITELIAGKRQGNIVSSLMNNFDTAREALEVSLDSSGSAMQEHAKWQKSLESQINNLKAAWQGLSQTFLNSSFLKNTIKLLTKLVNIIEKIVKTFGTMGTIGLGVGLYNIFKTNGIGSILSTFAHRIGGIASATGTLGEKFKAVGKAGKMAGKDIGSGMSSLSKAGTIIGLVITAVGLLVNAYKNAKEKQSRIRQEIIQTNDEFLDATSSFEQAYIKYSGRTSLTAEEEAELESAIKGTVDALGDKSSALQNVVNSSNDYVSSLEQITRAELEAAKSAANEKRNAAESEILSKTGFNFGNLIVPDTSEINVEIPNEDSKAGKIAKEIGGSDYWEDVMVGGKYKRYMLDIGTDVDADEVVKYYNMLLEYTERLSSEGLSNTTEFINANDVITELKNIVDSYTESVYESEKASYQLENGIPKTVKEYLKMREAILNEIDGTLEMKKNLAATLDSEYNGIFDLTTVEAQARKLIGVIDKYDDEEVGQMEAFLNMRTMVNNNDCSVGDYLSEFDKVTSMTAGWSEDEKEAFNTSFGIDSDLIKQQYDDVYDYVSRNYLSIQDIAKPGMTVFEVEEYKRHEEERLKSLLNGLTKTELQAVANIKAEIDWENATSEDILAQIKKEAEVIEALGFDVNIEVDKTALESLNTALEESASAMGLSSEALDSLKTKYSELEGYNPDTLFEATANGIKVNREELETLEKKYNDLNKAKVQEHIENLTEAYNDNVVAIDKCTNASERAKLISDNETYKSKIEELATYQAQLEGVTGAYQQWIDAQSGPEDYDGYESIATSREDIQGEIGRGFIGNKSKEYIDLLSGEDLDGGTIDDYYNAWEKLEQKVGSTSYTIHDFFTVDDEGDITSTGIDRFFKGMQQDFAGSVAKFNKKTGEWTYDFSQENLKKIQDEWGIGIEAIELLLEAAASAGYDVDWGGILDDIDLDTSSFETLVSAAESMQTAYNKIDGLDDVHFNFTATGIDEAESEIERARQAFAKFINEDGTVNLKADGAEEMQFILTTLIIQKQQLSTPAIMKVDTSQIDQAKTDVIDVINKAQELQSAYENYEIAISTGVDVAGAEEDLNNAITSLKNTDVDIRADLNLPSNADLTLAAQSIGKIKVGATLDDTSVGSIATKIQTECTPEVIAKVTGIDESAITNGEGGRQIKYTPEHSEVDAYINGLTDINKKIIFTYTTTGTKPNPSNIERTITYKYETEGERPKAYGTAHANGSSSGRAFARGNWGIKGNGVALGGELGRELVVRDGKFFTIGDEGAQFFQYRNNDIVFNAAQTESLFKYGGIKGAKPRGKMLATGSAFADGSRPSSGKAFWGATATSSRFAGIRNIREDTPKAVIKTETEEGNNSVTTTTTATWNAKAKGEGLSKSKDTNKNDSSGGSGGSSSADKFEETLDWIETKINRIERAIDKLDLKASSIYKSWSVRNKALVDEIDKVKEEIDIQQAGYERYIEEANSIGLSSSWAEKVRNGKIDIETITDEDLAEKIREYETWYEKALDCQDAIEELKEQEASLFAQRVENVSTQYEGILGVIEHEKNMLEEYISQTEAQGHLVSANYYEALASNEESNLAKLKQEKADMLSELQSAMESGTIDKYSESWYEMVASIDEVTLAITESETALLEYEQTLQQLSWETFDLLQERISAVSEEAEFLIELMSNNKLYDDNGQLTNEGSATMGLHGQNYNTYMYQADLVAQEIERLKAELAEDPYDTELEERYREMIALQQEYILAAEDEKNAIRDMVEEGIQLELEALQEKIDKYNEALESQKELYDYQNKVLEQTEEIASLEKQMAAYQGDDSEEAQAKIQELKVSLEEAEKNLEETEYEKLISDSQQMLDTLYLEYEEILNMRLDNIDALLADMITEINSDSSIISSTISSSADAVGYTLSESMKTIWNENATSTSAVITTYGEKFMTAATTTNDVLKTINVNLQNMITQLNKIAGTNVQSANTSSSANSSQANAEKTDKKDESKQNTTPESNTIKVGGKINAGNAKIYDYVGDNSGERQYYRNDPIYKVLEERNGYLKVRWHKLSSGITGWFKKGDVKAYATGKKNFLNDEIAWTQENGQEFIVRPSDGAILTPIARKDSVLNAEASSNIWNMANSPAEFIKDNLNLGVANVPNNSNVQSNYTQHLDKVVFNLPNVKNYEQLLSEMQKDKNFERLILSMSIDRIAGKSSLAKGKSIR